MYLNKAIFSPKWIPVGRLPGVPVYIEYRVRAGLDAIAVRKLPAKRLREGEQFMHIPLLDTRYRRASQQNFVQFLPKMPKVNPEQSFEVRKQGLLGDAYELRNRFDAVTDPSAVAQFLEICGPFIEIEGRHHTTWEEFQHWQKFFRDWRLCGSPAAMPPNIPSSPNDLIFLDAPEWSVNTSNPSGKKLVTAYLECATCLEAIAATVIVDFMTDVKWRECQYDRCRTHQRIFKLGKRGVEQKFCDRVCKELAKQQRRGKRVKSGSASMISETTKKPLKVQAGRVNGKA